MLKVPVAESFSVNAGTPGAPLQTTPTAGLAAMQEAGAAMTRFEHGVGAAGAEAAREITAAQIQTNESKAKEHDANVMGLIQGALYDPDTGYMQKKGRDAVDSREETTQKLTEAVTGMSSNLQNPAQQRLVAAATQMRVQSAIAQINQHSTAQNQVYQQSAGKVRLATATDGAALSFSTGDSATIAFNHDAPAANTPYQQYLQTIDSETRSQAALNGIRDKSIVDALVRDNLSTAYANTLEHMLGGAKGAKQLGPGDRAMAQAYFAKVEPQLTAAQIDRIKPQLQASGEQDAALNLSIDLGERIPLYADQVKELHKQFKDGKITSDVHKIALQELTAANTARRAEESEQDKKVLGDVWSMAHAGKTLGQLPPAQLAYIKQRGLGSSVDAIFKRNEPGGEALDDTKLYSSLAKMSAEDPAGFTRMDLATMSGQLSKSHWDHLVGIQTGINRSDVKSMEGNKLVHTAVSDAKESLRAAGINMSPKPGTSDAKKAEEFEAGLRDSLTAAQRAKGDKPLTREEARAITNGILKDQALSGTGYFGTAIGQQHMPAYKMTPEQKVAPWVVPDKERALITDSLKRKGVAVTEDNIQRTYKLKQGVQ